MKIEPVTVAPILVCLLLSLGACKQRAEATPSANSAALRATAGAQSAPAAAPPATPAVGAPSAATEQSAFDFNSIAESTAKIPPFPYVDTPPKLNVGYKETKTSPMDEIYVILGKRLHRLEGRVEMRTFPDKQADMAEVEIRRNYESTIKALGGVKVNDVGPDHKAFLGNSANQGNLEDKLRIPESGLSYDVYLMRKGPVRHWIVLMVNDRTTRLVSIEEQAFTQSVGVIDNGDKTRPVTATGAPPSSVQPVDLNTIAVTNSALPPFPYIAYPPELGAAFQETRDAKFDALSVIVGNHLQAVEGRVSMRSFNNRDANMSKMALRRTYEAAVKELGGVKLSAVAPEDRALIAANGDEYKMREKTLRILEANMSYDTYLIRTPQKRVWIVLMFGDSKTRILTVEEKDFVQSVALISADTMRTELAAKGRIALYINFDTDKASIRADGKPTVDEITALLKKDPTLKLTIEGHTDNSGESKHNTVLSQQRADAVMHSLVAAGVDKARLSASGVGDARPLADNKDEQGRAKNRRVELVKVSGI
jgi:OOP family OmpA-OmpF porin